MQSARLLQHTQNRNRLLIEKGQYDIIEDIRGGNCMFAGIQLGKRNTAVGIDHRLLVDPAHPFDGSNIVGVLRHQVTRVFRFDLPWASCFSFLRARAIT